MGRKRAEEKKKTENEKMFSLVLFTLPHIVRLMLKHGNSREKDKLIL